MSKNIVGIYQNSADANQARQALKDAGVSQSEIRTISPADLDGEANDSSQSPDAKSTVDKISDFFGSVFGESDDEKVGSRYRDQVRGGATLVVVDTDNQEHAEQARRILDTDQSEPAGGQPVSQQSHEGAASGAGMASGVDTQTGHDTSTTQNTSGTSGTTSTSGHDTHGVGDSASTTTSDPLSSDRHEKV